MSVFSFYRHKANQTHKQQARLLSELTQAGFNSREHAHTV